MRTLTTWQKALSILALGFCFFLVFSPHLDYHLPFHIDEWHHISEAIRLGNYGEYIDAFRDSAHRGFSGVEIGFHFVLFLLSLGFNLTSIYQFLPAIWATLGAGVLFFITFQKTDKNFWTALAALLFFASIKSNVNLTGLWFFTPLTFSIPLIFTYIYLFSEGLAQQKRTYLVGSLAIMSALIFTHSISVLFALPALIVYMLMHYRYVLREYKIFLSMLVVGCAGILFYKEALDIPGFLVWKRLFEDLQFNAGWGVLELKNSIFEVYSATGYVFALIGIIWILFKLKAGKQYALYLLWPATVIASIIFYRISGISWLSPYQRNFYYMAISLPMLSAIGLVATLQVFYQALKEYAVHIAIGSKQISLAFIGTCVAAVILFYATFTGYYLTPTNVTLYQVTDQEDLDAFEYLRRFPESTVMASSETSVALYPLTGHHPVGTLAFYGDRLEVERFFWTKTTCGEKNAILKNANARYILTERSFGCDWNLIYHEEKRYIYEFNLNES